MKHNSLQREGIATSIYRQSSVTHDKPAIIHV